jgi:ppGpp synthetase/RelA/SpoT-type nucleotidyltranferase
MSKYNSLWEFIQKNGTPQLKLTFDEIHDIAGIEIDHSFLSYKKELPQYGYQVGKISMKEKTVMFNKIVQG